MKQNLYLLKSIFHLTEKTDDRRRHILNKRERGLYHLTSRQKKTREMDEVSVFSGRLTITNDMSHFRVKQDRSCLQSRTLIYFTHPLCPFSIPPTTLNLSGPLL